MANVRISSKSSSVDMVCGNNVDSSSNNCSGYQERSVGYGYICMSTVRPGQSSETLGKVGEGESSVEDNVRDLSS
jgi:hypothetical protein